MPINMQVEYPKLEAENQRLKYENESLKTDLGKAMELAYQSDKDNKRLKEALRKIICEDGEYRDADERYSIAQKALKS